MLRTSFYTTPAFVLSMLLSGCPSSDSHTAAGTEPDGGATEPDASHACTEIGCSSGLEATMPWVLSFSDITKTTLEVCRADACAELPLTFTEEPAPSGGVVVASDYATLTEGDPSLDVTLWRDDKSAYRLVVRYYPGSVDDLADGDTYRLTLKNADGVVGTSTVASVHYEELFPNGTDCPPRCLQAMVSTELKP